MSSNEKPAYRIVSQSNANDSEPRLEMVTPTAREALFLLAEYRDFYYRQDLDVEVWCENGYGAKLTQEDLEDPERP